MTYSPEVVAHRGNKIVSREGKKKVKKNYIRSEKLKSSTELVQLQFQQNEKKWHVNLVNMPQRRESESES